MITLPNIAITQQCCPLYRDNIEFTINADNLRNKTTMISEYTLYVDELERLLTPTDFNDIGIKIIENEVEVENENNSLYANEININSFALLNYSYKKEFKRVEKKYQPVENSIIKTFSHVRKYLSILPIERCAVEINSDNTIKVTLSFLDNKLLMLTKSINDEENHDDEVMYSYFINRKLIASDVANFKKFTEGFKEYIS